MATYQSTVQLKGKDKPIYVSKKGAEEIARIYQDPAYSADHPLNLGNKIYFRKGDIKNIEVLNDIDKPQWEEQMTKFYAEEKENRARTVKLSPQSKAKHLDMFSLLYKSATGDDPSEDKLAEARSIQERFFIKNNHRTLCDPGLFKAIIPFVPGKRIDMYQSAGFRVVERAVLRDIELSR